LNLIGEISQGVDALEVRVDLFKDHSPDFIREQIGLVRRHSKLPIIFTVRTLDQGGKFSNNEETIFSLLKLGIRLGCEYIDVEITSSFNYRNSLLSSKQRSKVIASFHDPQGVLSFSELKFKFEEATQNGKADVVKIVGFAKEMSDNFQLRNIVDSLDLQVPVVAICMGEKGKLSRVLNRYMTPVTHPALPFKAAPGQLSVKEIQELRKQLGLTPEKQLYLFGSPISQSLSPTLHNSGFSFLGIPFTYHLAECQDAGHVKNVANQDSFLGGSVTIPLKEGVIPLLDSISPDAKAIGAVNTLVKIEGKLYGDNTDWLGIKGTLSQKLTEKPQVGLIIGAGGTSRAACYALKKLGIQRLIIYNRTPEKAAKLAQEFGGEVCPNLDNLVQDENNPLDNIHVIIGTIPANAQGEGRVSFPEKLFKGKPVVVELAYRPMVTQLVEMAQKHGCQVVHGLDILIEQALYQFRIWTCCSPPADIMAAAARKAY